MEPTNKIIRALNEQINKVKLEDNVFNDKKQTKQYALTNIKTKISTVLDRQKELRDKRQKAKEIFYGQMCDYEIQQTLIKDIDWITQTKKMVVERSARD